MRFIFLNNFSKLSHSGKLTQASIFLGKICKYILPIIFVAR